MDTWVLPTIVFTLVYPGLFILGGSHLLSLAGIDPVVGAIFGLGCVVACTSTLLGHLILRGSAIEKTRS